MIFILKYLLASTDIVKLLSINLSVLTNILAISIKFITILDKYSLCGQLLKLQFYHFKLWFKLLSLLLHEHLAQKYLAVMYNYFLIYVKFFLIKTAMCLKIFF